MPTLTSATVHEWKLKEMARRAGKKFEPEKPANPYEGMTKEELKAQKALIKAALKDEAEEE